MPLDLRSRPVDFSPIEQLLTELQACYEETERFVSQEFDQLLHYGEQRRQLAAQENGWVDEIRQTLDLLENAADRLVGDDVEDGSQPESSLDAPSTVASPEGSVRKRHRRRRPR